MQTDLEKRPIVEDKGFHLKLAEYFVKRIIPFCKDPILDLGCGVGVITKSLVDLGFQVVGLDGSKRKVEMAKKNVPGTKFEVALFEQYEPENPFNTVISKNVFEHFRPENTRLLAKNIFSWLNPGGRVIVYVPNALSLNRRVGFHMGLSTHYSELTEKDIASGHVQLYTRQALELEFNEAGFKILEIKGLVLKPFPNVIMEFLNERICDALFEVGNDPLCADLCSGIYIVGERPS